jgi:hypothetical protein
MSDDRLYEEMDITIKRYDAGQIGFRSLLDRLEECADNVSADFDWQDVFRRIWGRMELEYAADQGWKQIPDNRMPEVLSALADVRSMVSAKLAKLEGRDKPV